jgi:predicted DNA-binding protein
MSNLNKKRTDSIRIRLSSDMMEKFEALSSNYGMPMATLGAFAIANFVQRESNSKSSKNES